LKEKIYKIFSKKINLEKSKKKTEKTISKFLNLFFVWGNLDQLEFLTKKNIIFRNLGFRKNLGKNFVIFGELELTVWFNSWQERRVGVRGARCGQYYQSSVWELKWQFFSGYFHFINKSFYGVYRPVKIVQ